MTALLFTACHKESDKVAPVQSDLSTIKYVDGGEYLNGTFTYAAHGSMASVTKTYNGSPLKQGDLVVQPYDNDTLYQALDTQHVSVCNNQDVLDIATFGQLVGYSLYSSRPRLTALNWVGAIPQVKAVRSLADIRHVKALVEVQDSATRVGFSYRGHGRTVTFIRDSTFVLNGGGYTDTITVMPTGHLKGKRYQVNSNAPSLDLLHVGFGFALWQLYPNGPIPVGSIWFVPL